MWVECFDGTTDESVPYRSLQWDQLVLCHLLLIRPICYMSKYWHTQYLEAKDGFYRTIKQKLEEQQKQFCLKWKGGKILWLVQHQKCDSGCTDTRIQTISHYWFWLFFLVNIAVKIREIRCFKFLQLLWTIASFGTKHISLSKISDIVIWQALISLIHYFTMKYPVEHHKKWCWFIWELNEEGKKP